MGSGKELMFMYGSKRFAQLTFIFSEVTGKNLTESEMIIKSTSTGKKILEDDETLLYEQHTENIFEIVEELKEDNNNLSEAFTIEKVISAIRKMPETGCSIYSFCVQKAPELKKFHRRVLNKKVNRMLLTKKQNNINAWRMQ